MVRECLSAGISQPLNADINLRTSLIKMSFLSAADFGQQRPEDPLSER